MIDLKTCKTKDLDDIFYATKESQGTENAISAIKYVLFDDDSVLEGKKPEDNKYLYISSTNNARKKAMLMQQDDITHILIKYCMSTFGLRGKDFIVNEEELLLNLQRIERLELSAYEMIEQIAYAAIGNIYNAIDLLYGNQNIFNEIVDYMLSERYISEYKDSLDNFSGIIDNNNIDSEKRFAFYDAYCNIDKTFEEIKRNNPDYIK
ncbi:MAG: hypothetical protein ACI4XM_04430 [Candidatus Coprovivens sp.]